MPSASLLAFMAGAMQRAGAVCGHYLPGALLLLLLCPQQQGSTPISAPLPSAQSPAAGAPSQGGSPSKSTSGTSVIIGTVVGGVLAGVVAGVVAAIFVNRRRAATKRAWQDPASRVRVVIVTGLR